ncbi:uncharacterized protein LOC113522806 [Galleria mellonella]|uniref:Uncharacterized protein LOC113522806 n=1 Tax=Galleria mellonella TaxID=7137 RepID=A0ABM3N5I9_GALME|nr:uncharacterized protein LOC113522806 [Galleria mellonella]XP_031769872.2 uncharacterized protein LOC113522806 [Galleria mellonella]XP_052758851.1 uncharacterized protein LOC113522806 [Galleria mellonella]
MESSRHVSLEQVNALINFMGQHVEFATGSLRSLEARHTSKRLWCELTKTLNSYRGGIKKNSDGWSKYWSDFKNKLKNKTRMLKKNSSVSKKSVRPLTKLERRALVILGPHFERKIIGTVQSNDGFSNNYPSEIKLEAYQENMSNDFNKTMSDTSDRLSGENDERNSDESAESSDDDNVEVSENNSNESLVHNLYPKWLIDIEKKRANAELLRAKAEEQRASVAAKTAEAALIQAEALRKLADATSTQAEALVRIAMVLENRNHRDILSI